MGTATMDAGTPKPEQDQRGVSTQRALGWLRENVMYRVAMSSLALCAAGIALLAIAFFLPGSGKSLLAVIVQEIGGGLLIVGFTSAVVKLLIDENWNKVRDEQQKLEAQQQQEQQQKQLRGIEAAVEGQTKHLLDLSATLGSLDTLGISRVYARKQDFARDLVEVMRNPDVTHIRALAITLNDLRTAKEFEPVLELLWQYAEHGRAPSSPALKIEFLIINPTCQGASLRALGEAREDHETGRRLDAETAGAFRMLTSLQQHAAKLPPRDTDKPGELPVTVEFRLYNLPPTLFLVHTDQVSFAQPYYFWRSRDYDESMPIVRCTSDSRAHKGLADHFEFIWKYASEKPLEWWDARWWDQRCYGSGTDAGVREWGILNIFVNPEVSRRRIAHLLKITKRRLFIKGISLHSFFDPEGELLPALKQLIRNPNVEVKILLLDPNSQQARYRAYREWLIEHGSSDLSFERWQETYSYPGDLKLPHDTHKTISRIQGLMDSLVNAETPPNFEAKRYDCAPSCFVLIADDTALVEQYHFGKAADDGQQEGGRARVILGKDMAVYEYGHPAPQAEDRQVKNDVYALLLDDFNFVFDKCAYPLNQAPDTANHVRPGATASTQ